MVEVSRTVNGRTRTKMVAKSRHCIKGPSAYTQNRDEADLKRLFEHGVVNGFITKAEVPTIKMTARSEEQRGCFEVAQFDKLVAHLKDDIAAARNDRERAARLRFYYYVRLHAFTGMRPGTESADLTFGHFVDADGGGVVIQVDGKTGKRPVVAPPEVRTIVEALRALHGDVATPSTRLWDAGEFSHVMKRHLRELDMTVDGRGLDLALYSLRHFYITTALYAGKSVHEIADNCGTSLAQIEGHYAHVLQSLRSMGLMKSHLPVIAI
jgi:integrase